MARRVHTSTALQDRCKIAARCGVLRREQGLALGVRTATWDFEDVGTYIWSSSGQRRERGGQRALTRQRLDEVPTAKLQEDLGVETRGLISE